MRYRQFKITEAPGDSADFKKTLQTFYSTLTKKNPEDGLLANNARKNENMRLVAQFAQDNDLQSMLNPLTGKSYKFADASDADVPGETEPEEVNMDLPTLERMADVGGLPPGVMEKLGNEMLAAKSGEAGLGGRTVSSLFGIKDPETADKIQNIMAKNAAAGTAEPTAAGTDAGDTDAKLSGPETLSRLADIPAVSKALGARGDMDADSEFSDPNVMTKKAKAKPEHPGKPHPKPSASTKNDDGSRVTYSSLAAKSGIKDPNKIGIGDKITLPGGGEYIVKKGDTLSKIAQDVRLGNIGAPVKPGPTLGQEVPLKPDAAPLTGPTLGPEAPLPAAPAPAKKPDISGMDDAGYVPPKGDISGMDDAGYVPVAPAPAPAPAKKPDISGMDDAGYVPVVAPAKKPDNVRLPTTKRTPPPKTKKAVASPFGGDTVMAGYDGMPRLKYLAGIKEENKNE